MTTIRKISVALAATLVCALAQAQGAGGGSTGTKEPNDTTTAQPTTGKMSREDVKAQAKSESSTTKKMNGETGEGSAPAGDTKHGAGMKHKHGDKMAKPKPDAPEKDIAKP